MAEESHIELCEHTYMICHADFLHERVPAMAFSSFMSLLACKEPPPGRFQRVLPSQFPVVREISGLEVQPLREQGLHLLGHQVGDPQISVTIHMKCFLTEAAVGDDWSSCLNLD